MAIDGTLTAEMGYPEQEIDLFRGKKPMTVACALQDGDRLYIAADSAVGGLPVKTTTDTKIEFVESPPLAWVTSIDEAIGDMFGEWLRQKIEARRPEFGTWRKATPYIAQGLAELNGDRRRVSQLNRSTPVPSSDFCEVLLVGYIEGVPEIVHFAVSGDWTLHVKAGRRFASTGAGIYHAAMAYEVLREKGNLPPDGLKAIREVMDLTVKHAPYCEPPVHIRYVTPGGVKEVDG